MKSKRKLNLKNLKNILIAVGILASLSARADTPSAIKLVNTVESCATLKFEIEQGTARYARVDVRAGDSADVPTTPSYYTAFAETTVEGNLFTSAPIDVPPGGVGINAQVIRQEAGLADFELNMRSGSDANTIVLENMYVYPVQFNLTQVSNPQHKIVRVVQGSGKTAIDMTQRWTVHALCNGILTTGVDVADPNATVTAVTDNSDIGLHLEVK